jgi:hypothetical protein
MGNSQTIPMPKDWKQRVYKNNNRNTAYHFDKSKNLMNQVQRLNRNTGQAVSRINRLQKQAIVTNARVNDSNQRLIGTNNNLIEIHTDTRNENNQAIHKLDEDITTNRRKYYYKTELENFYKRTTKMYRLAFIIIALIVLGAVGYVYKSQIMGAVSSVSSRVTSGISAGARAVRSRV